MPQGITHLAFYGNITNTAYKFKYYPLNLTVPVNNTGCKFDVVVKTLIFVFVGTDINKLI